MDPLGGGSPVSHGWRGQKAAIRRQGGRRLPGAEGSAPQRVKMRGRKTLQRQQGAGVHTPACPSQMNALHSRTPETLERRGLKGSRSFAKRLMLPCNPFLALAAVAIKDSRTPGDASALLAALQKLAPRPAGRFCVHAFSYPWRRPFKAYRPSRSLNCPATSPPHPLGTDAAAAAEVNRSQSHSDFFVPDWPGGNARMVFLNR